MGWWNFGDSCYHNSGAVMNWFDAHDYCLEIGGYLVEIDTAEEEDWLLGAFAVYDQDYWIGLTDAEEEGRWIWADAGFEPKYTAWRRGSRTTLVMEKIVPFSLTCTTASSWTDLSGSTPLVTQPICPTTASTPSTPSVRPRFEKLKDINIQSLFR